MVIAIGPRRVGHVNLFVSDLARSVEFYQSVCGFTEVFREPGIEMAFLSNGNSHHDIALMQTTNVARTGRGGHVQVQPGRGRRPALNHIGFEMNTEADLVDAIHRLKEAHIRIDRMTDHQMAHSIYLYDPDGHMLEFYADVVEDWRLLYTQLQDELISGPWDPEESPPLTSSLIDRTPHIVPFESGLLPARATTSAALPVRDLNRSVAFYSDVVGLEPVNVGTASGVAVLRGSAREGGGIFLIQADEMPSHRLVFAGVRLLVSEPLGETCSRLRASETPCAVLDHQSPTALAVRDPDGLILVYSHSALDELMLAHGTELVTLAKRLDEAA